jgi:hypothetical protein
MLKTNEKLAFPVPESNKSRIVGKLRYWRCWLVATVLLLFAAAPALLVAWILVPVAIKNTDWMMGKGTGVAFPGEIEMVILPPISTKEKTTDDVMDLLLVTRDAIASELEKET